MSRVVGHAEGGGSEAEVRVYEWGFGGEGPGEDALGGWGGEETEGEDFSSEVERAREGLWLTEFYREMLRSSLWSWGRSMRMWGRRMW